MDRVVKFINRLRRPTSVTVVAHPGDVVIFNGIPYAVYQTHLTRIPINPSNKHN